MCLWGCFYNTGQGKNSIENILVHENLYNNFVNQLSEKAYETFQLMDPSLDEANFGCIPWAEAVVVLEDTVADA